MATQPTLYQLIASSSLDGSQSALAHLIGEARRVGSDLLSVPDDGPVIFRVRDRSPLGHGPLAVPSPEIHGAAVLKNLLSSMEPRDRIDLMAGGRSQSLEGEIELEGEAVPVPYRAHITNGRLTGGFGAHIMLAAPTGRG